MHTILPYLLRRTIRVGVVGCGGTGSAVVGGLPHLHQALIAGGHPSGLAVTVIDGDRISAANCVRQPFSASEIGRPSRNTWARATICATILILSSGAWTAEPRERRYMQRSQTLGATSPI